MRVIHVMGAAGCGKTTLGKALAQCTGYRHVDTDDIYWLPSTPPFEKKRDVDDRIRRLAEVLQEPHGMILTGSITGWGDDLLQYLDGVVFMTAPTAVRVERLAARELERYGYEMYADPALREGSEAFLRWAAAYDEGTERGRSRSRDEAWLDRITIPVLRLDGRLSVERQVRTVLDWCKP
ncbi:MAG TPA: AAA family ATPase [Candidatus Elarobacter sp.]|jgi:cytidylate kinase|nr:AAA family ATPase [Candidatus Elarobacter sp.]